MRGNKTCSSVGVKFCHDSPEPVEDRLSSKGFLILLNAFLLKIILILNLCAGVHTSDILTVYISAIKALRELDPSMVILQVACQPIRKYLR